MCIAARNWGILLSFYLFFRKSSPLLNSPICTWMALLIIFFIYIRKTAQNQSRKGELLPRTQPPCPDCAPAAGSWVDLPRLWLNSISWLNPNSDWHTDAHCLGSCLAWLSPLQLPLILPVPLASQAQLNSQGANLIGLPELYTCSCLPN